MNDANAIRAIVYETSMENKELREKIEKIRNDEALLDEKVQNLTLKCRQIRERLDKTNVEEKTFTAWLDTIEDKSLRVEALRLRRKQFMLSIMNK